MAVGRKKKTTGKVAPGAASVSAADAESPEAGLVVHRSPQQQRVELLEKEHERLLRDIAKKRAAVQATSELARDLMNAFFASVSPLKAQLEGLVREVRDLFESLLGPTSRLGRRDKTKVRNIYATVMNGLPPDLQQIAFDEDDAASFDVDDFGDDAENTTHSRRGSTRSARSDDELPGDAGYSAHKPDAERASTLRALFRRLAIALHPDKVQDPGEKEERTAVMQDVTRAYEAGDVARLVELERSFLASMPTPDDPDALQRQEQRLCKANEELRRQLRQLTAEQKAVRDSVPVRIDLRSRGKAQQEAKRELDGILAGAQREVDEFRALRDFVQSFANGKIGLLEFLSGPPSQHDDEGDLLESLLESLLDEEFSMPPRRTAVGRRSSRRRG